LASVAPSRNRVENAAFAPGDPFQDAQPSDGDGNGGQVVAVVSADAAGPLAGMVLSSQISSAVSLTATQAGALLSLDLVATARPDSSSDASPHGDRVADAAGVLGTSGTHPTSPSPRERVSALLADVNLDDFPGPSGDDLMAVVLPFDRTSLERAVDHFFQQLDELEVRDLVGTDLSHIVFLSLGLATSVAALELARRRLRFWTAGGNAVRVRDSLVPGDDLEFPDLPGSWSSRLT
jgi:hypothetical protein